VKKLFSTDDVHPRDRFAYWQDVARKTLVDRDATTANPATFHANLHVGRVADMQLIQSAISPVSLWHTAEHAARGNVDDLMICRMVRGQLEFTQFGRDTMVAAGDAVLLDPRYPYAGHYLTDSRALILKIHRRELEARIGDTRSLSGQCISHMNGENRMTLAILAMLPCQAETLRAAEAETFKEYVIDLAAMSLTRAAEGQHHRASSARSCALFNVRAAIEARLSDPSLDSEAVAGAAGVTVRYANAVLADEGTSIQRLILTRRLERCRRALEDPRQRHRTVSEIAYGWGFSDMTHFGRRFKAAYGALPSEFRRRAKFA